MTDLPLYLQILTAIGVVAFAASGALVAARAGMDWLGVTTLAAATAIGGGTVRDLLIDRVPGWLTDFWPYVILIGATVAVVWFAARLFPSTRFPRWVDQAFTTTDAIGLATFTVVGTDIARDAGYTAGPAVVLGVIGGIGGGIIRDLLASRRVEVFSGGEVYGLAAIFASVTFVLAQGLPGEAAAIIAVLVGLAVRMIAVTLGLRAPTLGPTEPPRHPPTQ